MPKFLHTADWHIGLRARHAGARGAALRVVRLESAKAILNLAVSEAADFILIAGDLFDHPDVERGTIDELVNILNQSRVPIFVIPGNHDPLLPMSVWESQSWKSRLGHVRFLDVPGPVDAPGGCTLFACPIFQKTSIEDPTAWIPDRQTGDRSVRIGLAHGSLKILNEQTPMEFPIATDRAAKAGLDYLALGDWHGMRIVGATAYPGTHEQTSFADRESGNVLVVEIAEAGAVPVIRPHRVGKCVWARIDRTVRDLTDVEALRSEIRQLGPVESLVLDLSLRVSPDARPETIQARRELTTQLSDAFWLQTKAEEFSLAEAVERIPDGYLRGVFEALSHPGENGLSIETATEAQTWMAELAVRVAR